MLRSSRRRPLTLAAIASVTVFVAASMAGCGGSDPTPADDQSSEAAGDEASAHDDRVCPRSLPQADEPFGPSKPATSTPSLPIPESAWVCRYHPTDTAPGSDEQGTAYAWTRRAAPVAVPGDALPAIADSLTELTPADAGRMCTADLGPRWMLVYTHGTDLTGVVVDDFGCRSVRLTDDPFETVPGESTGSGTVPGVLEGPAGLPDQLQAIVGPAS